MQFLPQCLRHARCNLHWTAFLKRPDMERSNKWNASLWRFKLVSMGFYLWLRRFCKIHPPSLKLLPLMKVTTWRQRENKKFQCGSAQLSKLFYKQKQGLSLNANRWYFCLVGSEILYFILCNIFCSKPKPHFIWGLHSASLHIWKNDFETPMMVIAPSSMVLF